LGKEIVNLMGRSRERIPLIHILKVPLISNEETR